MQEAGSCTSDIVFNFLGRRGCGLKLTLDLHPVSSLILCGGVSVLNLYYPFHAKGIIKHQYNVSFRVFSILGYAVEVELLWKREMTVSRLFEERFAVPKIVLGM